MLFSPEMESGLVVRPMKSYPLIGAAFFLSIWIVFCVHTLFKIFRFILKGYTSNLLLQLKNHLKGKAITPLNLQIGNWFTARSFLPKKKAIMEEKRLKN